ncbi:MAG: hypothetical protein H6868_05600 [Rhodospirillales bacterium]|nr:hypothetical protein [Rhodospirillales bacterium]
MMTEKPSGRAQRSNPERQLRLWMTATLMLFAMTALVIPSAAQAACSSPVGAAGSVGYFSADSTYRYCDDTNWVDMSAKPYFINAVECDGVNDYLMRGADLTGNADSKKVSGSLWFRKNVTGQVGVLYIVEGGRFLIQTEVGNKVRVKGDISAGGTTVLSLASTTTITDTGWHHLLFSADLDVPGSAKMYIDDVDVSNVVTFDGASGNIDFTAAEHAVCSNASSADLFDGDVADLWLDFGTYIDFSVAANRRKFIDADGNPVPLGKNGEGPTGTSPIVFLSGDTADWHTNKGTGGGFTENGALTDAVNDPGNLPYTANAVHFDGTSDYLTRGADLTGTSDSRKLLVSYWFRRDSSGVTAIVASTDNSHFLTQHNSSGRMLVKATNGAGGELVNLRSPNVSDTSWHHLIASVDLDILGSGTLYFDDDPSGTLLYQSTVGDNIDFTNPNFGIGANPFTAGGKFDGDLADVYINYGEYLDLTVEANRRRFIDAAGNPVYLGADGSKPTGNVPIVYVAGDTATWHTNLGSGGGFTENGALTDAGTNPGWKSNGLVGYWKLDETSGTIAADSSGNGNNGTMAGGLDATNDSVPGKINTAIDFDGGDDTVLLGSPSLFDNMDTYYTFSAWIKTQNDFSSCCSRIIAIYKPSSALAGIEISATERAQFNNRDSASSSSALSGGPSLADGKWHLVTGVRDNADFMLYVDGILVNSNNTPSVGDTTDAATNWYIGSAAGSSEWYKGSIDDARIYNRALSGDEVANLYCETAAGVMDYNVTDDVLTFCSGLGRHDINITNPGTGGTSCAASGTIAAAPVGAWQYDTTNKKMVYCDGTNWRNAGE